MWPAFTIALATVPGDWTDVVAFSTLLAAQASLVALGACVAIPLGIRTGFFVVPALFLALVLLPAFVINDILLRNQPFSVMALSYMWSLSIPQPGTTLAMSTEFIRLLFYTLVIVVAIAAAAGLAEARAAGNRRAALATCWFLLPLAVSVIIATIMPVLGQRDTENGVRCTDHPGFRLCLYPNDERGRRFVAESVAVIAEPLPGMRAMPSITFTQEYEPAVESSYFIDRLSTSRTNWIQVVYRNSEGLYIGVTCGPSEAIESDSIKQSLFHRVGETRGPEAPRVLRDRRVRIVAQRRRTGAAGISTSRRPSLHRVVRAHQSQFFDCTISKKDLP